MDVRTWWRQSWAGGARDREAAPASRRRRLAGVGLALVGVFVAGTQTGAARLQPNLPDRLSDSAFWALSTTLSEPGGYFRSDNLVGNEVTLQHPIPELLGSTPRGGVYLGVGPDQNFTYIVAMRPRIAFIVDIRRLNVIQHLFYKALVELAPTRADFLSLLFGRPRPPGLDTTSSVDVMMDAYGPVVPDSLLYQHTVREVRHHLVAGHRFPLTDEEASGLEYVATAFFGAGPNLTYNFGTGRGGFGGRRSMPTYGTLMSATDAAGVPRGYLATEQHYRVLRDLEMRNLIVPVTGDFAGDHALRAVGQWVREHGATVTAMYTSNVEQYLFQSEANWRRFFENVATFPTTPQSTFIRAIFNMGWGYAPGSPGPRSVTLLCPIERHVHAYREGALADYADVTSCPTP